MSRLALFIALSAIFAAAVADNGCGTCLTGAVITFNHTGLHGTMSINGVGCPGTCPITLRYDIDWCVTKTASVPGGYVVSPRNPFLYVFNFTGSTEGTFDISLDDTATSAVHQSFANASLTDADGHMRYITTAVPVCNSPPPTSGTPVVTTGVQTTGAATTGEAAPVTTGVATTSDPLPSTTGTPTCVACGDPHFQGLNGHRFEFQGVSNKTFALISDPIMQFNSRFIPARFKHTFLGASCIRVCDDIVNLAPTAYVTVNGKSLKVGREFNRPGRLTVRRTHKHEVELEVADRWKMHVRVADHVDLVHVTPLFAWDEKTHGVLGHTLKPLDTAAVHQRCNSRLEGGCDVEGAWTDYEVLDDDICSTKWTHAMFNQDACH